MQTVADAGTALESRLSAGYKNDEDSINRPGALREDIQGLFFGIFGSQGPPISTHDALESQVHARYVSIMADYRAWSSTAAAVR